MLLHSLKSIAIAAILGLAFLAIACLLTGTIPSARADGVHCWDLDGCPAKRKARAKRQLKVVIERGHEPTAWTPEKHCLKELVRGLGTQWIGTEGALSAAKKDWMERVRYDHGETYLDLTHAEDVENRCGRVSIGEVAGQVTYRCEILARPCKAEFEKIEGAR